MNSSRGREAVVIYLVANANDHLRSEIVGNILINDVRWYDARQQEAEGDASERL